MTGPEKETLSVLLRLVENVQDDIRDVKVAVQAIDTRVKEMEIKDATQVGVAAGTAAVAASNAAQAEKRAVSMARLFAVIASATAAGASVAVVLNNLGVL